MRIAWHAATGAKKAVVGPAPPGTGKLLGAMFVFYLIGLSVLIASKL